MTLPELAARLRDSVGMVQKRDIQLPADRFAWSVPGPWGEAPVRVGDDCAAIPDGDGYLLVAIEGMSPAFVKSSPRAAGFCSVLVNASDVYSMGGRPLAVVDALFDTGSDAAPAMLEGMQHAASTFGIPVVGGHTNLRSPYIALAVAIVGRARALITSFDAHAGDDLVMAVDLRGKMLGDNPFWDATDAPAARLREDFAVLPALAEAGLVRAGKDISMGGLLGTLLMLIESSGVGADLEVERVPRPANVPLERWLMAFPSFGFMFAVGPANTERVLAAFAARGLAAARVGVVDASRKLTLWSREGSTLFWDLAREGLTQKRSGSRHA